MWRDQRSAGSADAVRRRNWEREMLDDIDLDGVSISPNAVELNVCAYPVFQDYIRRADTGAA